MGTFNSILFMIEILSTAAFFIALQSTGSAAGKQPPVEKHEAGNTELKKAA